MQVVLCAIMIAISTGLKGQSINATCSAGWDIFIPQKGDGHHYAPSIIINGYKSIDLCFASTGDKTRRWRA